VAEDALQHNDPLSMKQASDQDSEHERTENAGERMIDHTLFGVLREIRNFLSERTHLIHEVIDGALRRVFLGIDLRLSPRTQAGDLAAQRFDFGAEVGIAHEFQLSNHCRFGAR
jgi:hypothetical protein